MLSPAVDVGRTLDEGRWSSYQRRIVALAALAIIFDGIDNQLLGIAIPSFMHEWGLARAAFAPGLGRLSSASVGVFNLGGVAGAVAGGVLITRFGSRPTMLVMAAGAAAGSAVLSRMPLDPYTSVTGLLAALTFTGALINAVQSTLYALAGHIYPTRVRAKGIGAAASIGRSGGVVSGYAGPWAMGYNGSSSFFVLMGAAVAVTFVALAGVRRHVED